MINEEHCQFDNAEEKTETKPMSFEKFIRTYYDDDLQYIISQERVTGKAEQSLLVSKSSSEGKKYPVKVEVIRDKAIIDNEVHLILVEKHEDSFTRLLVKNREGYIYPIDVKFY